MCKHAVVVKTGTLKVKPKARSLTKHPDQQKDANVVKVHTKDLDSKSAGLMVILGIKVEFTEEDAKHYETGKTKKFGLYLIDKYFDYIAKRIPKAYAEKQLQWLSNLACGIMGEQYHPPYITFYPTNIKDEDFKRSLIENHESHNSEKDKAAQRYKLAKALMG